MKFIKTINIIVMIILVMTPISTKAFETTGNKNEKTFYGLNYLRQVEGSEVDEGSGDSTSYDEYVAGQNCEAYLGDDMVTWIKMFFTSIQVVGSLLVVILGIVDYMKASFSGNADSMKKANGDFSKRLIALVALLVLPALIKLILNIGSIPGLTSANPLCN